MDRVTLENDLLRVTVYPNRGGKTGSIYLKGKQFELLEQPRGGVYPPVKPGMPFHESDASGFDDVYPSMGAETAEIQGNLMEMPDHGQIWTAPMQARLENGVLSLAYACDSLPYHYEKKIYLVENRVCYEYCIHNLSDQPLPGVWVCHCLMRYEEGQTFEFPQDVRIARNLIPGTALGEANQAHDVFNSEYDFSKPPKDNSAIKFYFENPVVDGFCAVNYKVGGARAVMHFDSEKLPYLGFWMTTGAYRGDKNFAFEPASGYFDTINCARKNQCISEIDPNGIFAFKLSIELSEL